MQKLTVRDFDLGLTLESGQFFRYKKFAGMYYVNSADKVFVVGQNENRLIYDGVDKKFLMSFFGLNDDYSGIVRAISKDQVMKKLTTKYSGLHLIRQDPWECMMSYVCSSASNIPKIQKNVNLLSQSFGSPVQVAGYASHSFPEVGDIDNLPAIQKCKTGFRANYLYELNKMITPAQVAYLQNMDYEEVVNVLTQLPGIGPKVADCIALFSLGHTNAFPVDTHIRQVMRHCYPQLRNVSDCDIKEFAQDYFDPYAGYAELFLFEYGRKELNKN